MNAEGVFACLYAPKELKQLFVYEDPINTDLNLIPLVLDHRYKLRQRPANCLQQGIFKGSNSMEEYFLSRQSQSAVWCIADHGLSL